MIDLIIQFVKIGAFSFGGGIATLPHIYKMANETGWCNETEITNFISLSQITPGPLACNIATFVGNRVNGILGSIIAVLSFIIPAVIFMAIFTKVINKAEQSKKFHIVMSIVRGIGYATIIEGSFIIIKNTIFINAENLQLNNFLQMINIKSIIASVIIIIITKKRKISAIKTMGLGALLGLMIRI